MKYSDIVIVKRWIPILKEYERTKAKVSPRPFKFVKNLCEAHHISKKELSRYYHKWVEGGKTPESLLPSKRGAKPGSRRTPKDVERSIVNVRDLRDVHESMNMRVLGAVLISLDKCRANSAQGYSRLSGQHIVGRPFAHPRANQRRHAHAVFIPMGGSQIR